MRWWVVRWFVSEWNRVMVPEFDEDDIYEGEE